MLVGLCKRTPEMDDRIVAAAVVVEKKHFAVNVAAALSWSLKRRNPILISFPGHSHLDDDDASSSSLAAACLLASQPDIQQRTTLHRIGLYTLNIVGGENVRTMDTHHKFISNAFAIN